MTCIVPTVWPEWGLDTNEDAARRPLGTDVLVAHDMRITSAHKAQEHVILSLIHI